MIAARKICGMFPKKLLVKTVELYPVPDSCKIPSSQGARYINFVSQLLIDQNKLCCMVFIYTNPFLNVQINTKKYTQIEINPFKLHKPIAASDFSAEKAFLTQSTGLTALSER